MNKKLNSIFVIILTIFSPLAAADSTDKQQTIGTYALNVAEKIQTIAHLNFAEQLKLQQENGKVTIELQLNQAGELESVTTSAEANVTLSEFSKRLVSASAPFWQLSDQKQHHWRYEIEYLAKLPFIRVTPLSSVKNTTSAPLPREGAVGEREWYAQRSGVIHERTGINGLIFSSYIEGWRTRVERLGTLNYPAENGALLSGKVTLTVEIHRDGSIANVSVDRSSNIKKLDSDATQLARLLTGKYLPFADDFPKDIDILVITSTFTFMDKRVTVRGKSE